MELPLLGPAPGSEQVDGEQHLAQHNLKPHRVKTFKTLARSLFSGEINRRGGSVSESPGAGRSYCAWMKRAKFKLWIAPTRLADEEGRCGTLTHDYKRNGTTTLFAALELAQGKVVGQCDQRHRHQEFLKFSPPLRPRVSRARAPASGNG